MDLTPNVDVTVALLANPWDWRIRVVEQIDVDSPVSARRRRSLQCAPLRPVIAAAAGLADGGDAGPADEALVVVPVAPIPKGPLLEFDVEGPGGSPAFLVQRADIAEREAAFVAASARELGHPLPRGVPALLEAALGFTEGHWAVHRPNVEKYLADGLGGALEASAVRDVVDAARRAAEILRPFAEIATPLDSAVENPALAVPGLVELGEVGLPDAVRLVMSYVAWLSAVSTFSRSGAPTALDARTLLESLVDYGRNYDLMAVVAVPLDEPFLIKVSDRRPLTLSLANRGDQSVVVADARSNHVALRVTDPNFRLSSVRARSPDDSRDAYGTSTSRDSSEVHSLYAFEPDRDYRIALTFRVGLLWRLRLVPYALGVVLVLTAAAVYGLRPAPGDLALIAAPATFAATLLLSRESSALGSRLRAPATAFVAVAMAVLAGAAALALWSHRP